MNYVKSFDFFGVNAKEIPCITGEGAPTTSTEGAVGCLYMNTTNGDVYKCTAVSGGSYTWVALGNGDNITVDQSYNPDSTNAQSGKAVAEAIETLFDYKQANNYVDPSALTIGMVHFTGDVYTTGSFANYVYYENYIPVIEGETISLQWTDRNSGNRWWTGDASYPYGADYALSRVAAYDENTDILGTLGGSNLAYFTVPAGVKFIRVTIPKSLYDGAIDIAVTKNATSVIPYAEFDTFEISTIKKELLPAGGTNTVEAFLPDEICCAVGRTIEIYNAQVCPLAKRYHFQWDCSIGKAMKRKFSVTGTSTLVGDYPLALTIYDDSLNAVFSKTVTLKIVNILSTAKSICPIGDSLTNNKYWLNEVIALSSNQITFVGTRAYTSTIKHEGRSGFSSTSYLSATQYSYESEGVHPFWDSTSGSFSWSYYKTTSGLSPDAVQIFLGTNDFAGNTPADTFATNIKQMVDSVRQADTSIPIFVVFTICWGNQDGIGSQTSSDGFAAQKGRFKYDLDRKTIGGVKALYEVLKSYTDLYFIPLTQCHDSEYNFGAVEASVNPRASQKEYLPSESVHPQQQGYEQMADVMYSVYCRAFA